MKILVVEASAEELKKLGIKVEAYLASSGLLGVGLKKLKKADLRYIVYVFGSRACIAGVYKGAVVFRDCGSLEVIEAYAPGLLKIIEKKLRAYLSRLGSSGS